jgi:hypothetical protein
VGIALIHAIDAEADISQILDAVVVPDPVDVINGVWIVAVVPNPDQSVQKVLVPLAPKLIAN